jgi:hypothetical protein
MRLLLTFREPRRLQLILDDFSWLVDNFERDFPLCHSDFYHDLTVGLAFSARKKKGRAMLRHLDAVDH